MRAERQMRGLAGQTIDLLSELGFDAAQLAELRAQRSLVALKGGKVDGTCQTRIVRRHLLHIPCPAVVIGAQLLMVRDMTGIELGGAVIIGRAALQMGVMAEAAALRD